MRSDLDGLREGKPLSQLYYHRTDGKRSASPQSNVGLPDVSSKLDKAEESSIFGRRKEC